MKNDLLGKIKTLLPEMSKGRRSIGRYILENYDKAAFMTAAKLGEEVGVSESTVVRFACALGYEGYPELQDSLRELIRTKLTSVQRIEISNAGLGDGDVVRKVLNSDIANIRDTLEDIDRESFARAVDSVANAKMIYIIGMRSSASLAAFLMFYLRLMFKNVKLVQTTSGSEVFEEMLRVEEGDAVIAVSFPRYSKRIINAVEYAKSRHANVIALTDSHQSPIAVYADSTLTAKSDMASFVDSLVAPLSIINALIVAVGRKKSGEVERTFSRLEHIWDEYDVYDKESSK